MEYRLYILAGTFLLAVIAAAVFVVTLVRARRDDRLAPPRILQHDPSTIPARDVGVDTDLHDLNVSVSADAPSAALLTPLRTGAWQPAEDPAPAERLPAVSLEERIADFVPAPSVPEPAFATRQYAEWEVDRSALDSAERGSAQPALHELLPEVAPLEPDEVVAEAPPSVSRPVPSGVPEVWAPEHDDDFGAEIAALLPPAEPESPLGEQPAVEARPIAHPPVPAAPRPEVIVSAAEPPAPTPEPTPVPEPAASPRPRVRVAALDGVVPQSDAPPLPLPTTTPVPAGGREPDLVMVAPVELWFGDSRIGVKAGSATYDRFRKYADSLLLDLKDARSATR